MVRGGGDLAGHARDATGEPAIRLDGVSKRYADGTVAVADLHLDVADGELLALVGPSGCGKSTTLRMVNRLVEPTSGRVWLRGQDVTDADPVRLRRQVGYVIQAVGLFPHQTVRQNVATVPVLLGWQRRAVRERVDQLLGLVGLDPSVHGDRYPHELSGGQRQRVGVARALAADPPVLLMDEPFGAVDPLVRDRLQGEFRRLQRELGTTVLLVTHDIDEAVRMADRVAVFRQGGVLEQVADPATLLGAPATPFVADFVGAERGLRRLAVTDLDVRDLEHPPTVLLGDGAAAARTELQRVRSPYGIVLDTGGGLHGWVAVRDLLDGVVADVVRRFDAVLPFEATLKQAFSEVVQHDAGWLPVLDGERYVGVVTPDVVHAALRRTLPAQARSGAGAGGGAGAPDHAEVDDQMRVASGGDDPAVT